MHANFDDDDANVLDDNDDVWSGWPFLKLFGGHWAGQVGSNYCQTLMWHIRKCTNIALFYHTVKLQGTLARTSKASCAFS